LPAVRGEIRDRKGQEARYGAAVLQRLRDAALLTSENFARLRTVLGMNGDEALDVWERMQGPSPTGAARERERPVLLAEDISREAMAAIETGLDIPGVKIASAPRRSYPQGALAAHVLGFMNEVSADELRTKKEEGYRAGDLVGRSGIERQWEGYLRGRTGFQKVVVDRRGLPKPDIRELTDGPTRGRPCPATTSCSRSTSRCSASPSARCAGVRRRGRSCWTSTRGACWRSCRSPASIPTRCRGTSRPTPSSASSRIVTSPLRDKTVSETYYPGSTFKAVSALAALGGPPRHARGAHEVPRVVRDRAAPLPVHEDAPRR
jgi:penicillin-binding protein 2